MSYLFVFSDNTTYSAIDVPDMKSAFLLLYDRNIKDTNLNNKEVFKKALQGFDEYDVNDFMTLYKTFYKSFYGHIDSITDIYLIKDLYCTKIF